MTSVETRFQKSGKVIVPATCTSLDYRPSLYTVELIRHDLCRSYSHSTIEFSTQSIINLGRSVGPKKQQINLVNFSSCSSEAHQFCICDSNVFTSILAVSSMWTAYNFWYQVVLPVFPAHHITNSYVHVGVLHTCNM